MCCFWSCRKLGAEELTRQHVETQEALASEKVSQVEQEREKERQELKELRKQMADIERSLMQQVCPSACLDVSLSPSSWLLHLFAVTFLGCDQ